MKTCCTCKETKSLENFSIRKTGAPTSECKICSAKRSNDWYWINREKSLLQRKDHYEKNREHALTLGKIRYEKDKEKIREKARIRNKSPEERIKANKRTKEWNKKNPDIIRKRVREWKQKNPEKAKAHQYILWALRLNVIKKPSVCQMCGLNKKLEAHHKDYSKPLEVDWFCKLCHENEHHRLKNECSSAGELNILNDRKESSEVNGKC